MAARKPKAEPEAEAPAMLALIETPNNPAPTPVDQARIVLLDPQRFDQFYDRIKAETDAHVPDVSTVAGREAIRRLAFRVTKTHTMLKSASLELTESWRKQTAAVNAARGPMILRLTEHAAEVRKPLTEWEDAEDARHDANRATIAEIHAAALVTAEDTSETVAERGKRIWLMKFETPQWIEDEVVEADAAKEATVAVLVAAQKRLKVEEAEREELAQLRREKEERVAREAEEAAERERVAAEEQAERERLERERQAQAHAEEVERQRIAAEEQREREAAERVQRAAQEAADKARREAEEAAETARLEREAEAERARAAERAEEARKLAEAEAERDRLARQAREREAEEQRQREEAEAERVRVQREADEAEAAERKRVEDKAHRRAIMAEAVDDIQAVTGIEDREVVRKMVLAVGSGEIRHMEVKF